MATFNEFGKGEHIRISSRRETFFVFQYLFGKLKVKNIRANTTLEVQTNFVIEGRAWVFIRHYGWCQVPIKDWKITQIINPRHHAHCLEYAEELKKWLNQEPSKINDPEFGYVCLKESGGLD